jgi:cell division protein ZapA (FtsZ GTPase activity inhibitor)
MVEERPVQNPNSPSDKGEVIAINILGNEIRLRTEAGSAYIQKLAEDVEDRIKRCMSEAGIISSLKAVILTCLNFADELEKEKKEHQRKEKIWEERIDKLFNKIPSP